MGVVPDDARAGRGQRLAQLIDLRLRHEHDQLVLAVFDHDGRQRLAGNRVEHIQQDVIRPALGVIEGRVQGDDPNSSREQIGQQRCRPFRMRRDRFDALEDRRMVDDQQIHAAGQRLMRHRVGQVDRQHGALDRPLATTGQQADIVPVRRIAKRCDRIQRVMDAADSFGLTLARHGHTLLEPACDSLAATCPRPGRVCRCRPCPDQSSPPA